MMLLDFLLLLLCATPAAGGTLPTPAEALERARALAARMTLSEQLAMLQGNQTQARATGYIGWSKGVPRLGVPALKMNDGRRASASYRPGIDAVALGVDGCGRLGSRRDAGHG